MTKTLWNVSFYFLIMEIIPLKLKISFLFKGQTISFYLDRIKVWNVFVEGCLRLLTLIPHTTRPWHKISAETKSYRNMYLRLVPRRTYFIPKPILAEEIKRKGRIGRSNKFASSFWKICKFSLKITKNWTSFIIFPYNMTPYIHIYLDCFSR